MAEEDAPPSAKILVCDDDDTLVGLLESLFEGAGYEVVTASDGFECLEKVKSDKPDVMIIDLDMPHKNGFEVLEELSREGALAHRSLIVVSGRERKEDVERAQQYGAKAFITKPFSGETLVRMVHEVLEGGRTTTNG